MNIPLIKSWIKKLNSGEERQGKGALYALDGTKCCLGVVGCLLNPAWIKVVDFRGKEVYSFNRECHQHYLPQDVAEEELGLTRDEQDYLAELNDGGNATAETPYTFKEIAKELREIYSKKGINL